MRRLVKYNVVSLKFDMQKLTYRILLLFLASVIIFSCKKKSEDPPSLTLISDSGFTTTDRLVPVGMPLKIGIQGVSDDAPITNLVITMTNEYGTETALDSGLYAENLRFVKYISYGASSYEKWTFTIMDKNRKKTSLSVTLTKDPNSVFGQIDYYPSIKLGCHLNHTIGNFLNPVTGQVIFADSSDAVQNNVYITMYYALFAVPPTDYTFASPAENNIATYYPNITSWILPRNEVRYKLDSLTVSPQEFDQAFNDSLIISNYTSATVGTRKFKSARPGYVIPFQITAGAMTGKRGLIKMISEADMENGYVEFALKIQK